MRPSRIRVAVLVALIVGLLAAIGPGASPAAAGDKDCADFATQKAAQIFFLNHGGPRRDPHRLDADGDGIACETNPCPCYYGTKPPGGGGGGHQAGTVRQRAKVLRVVDGDTIDVKILGGNRKRVRLLGIDTPEVYSGVECWGPQASKSLEAMLPKGARVLLISDPSQDLKDRYNRLLRYVIKGKADVNKRQVVRGAAKVYVYQGNPFKRVKSYRAAQRRAKAQDRGLWGHC